MTEWQPIETAPKDGTEIVAFAPDRRDATEIHPDGSSKFASIVAWRPVSKDKWAKNHSWVLSGTEVRYADLIFTHWMPLPAPPTGTP